jgi:prepilin-type N-terminal cleavage/methylation domain-containing protein
MHTKSLKKNGFTLVELLVVISIIGVLAGLLLVNFVGVRGRASDARNKNDLAQFQKALRLYYNDFNTFPVGNGFAILGCGETGTVNCDRLGGAPFSAGAGNTLYMNNFPEDLRYYNSGGSNPDQFVLVIRLENPGDQEIIKSQERCAASIAAENLDLDEYDYVLCEN